jgi:hypothetical protein
MKNNKEKFIIMVQKIVNDDDSSYYIDKFFGGIDKFIDWIEKNNLQPYVDPFSYGISDYKSKFYQMMYKFNPDFIWQIIDNDLLDVIENDDKFYYAIDFSKVSRLFSTPSDYSYTDISDILSSNHYSNYDFDETFDIYEKLNKDNIQLIKKSVLSDFSLDKESVSNSLKNLLDSELLSVKKELISTYESCYIKLVQDEQYNKMWEPLIGTVVDNKNFISEKKLTKFGTINRIKYDSTNCIYNSIKKLLDNMDNFNFKVNQINGLFRYYTDILYFLTKFGVNKPLTPPKLDVRPDESELLKCFNDEVEVNFY